MGKRVDKIVWGEIMKVLHGNRFAALCAHSKPPPVDELRKISQKLVEVAGREAIARAIQFSVRIAVDTATEVFQAKGPSIKRSMDKYEVEAMKAAWKFLFEDHKSWEHKVRKEWSHLVDSGPISEPLQIFLELATFKQEIRPLLETITSIEGFTVLAIEGHDVLDAMTLAHVFMAFVTDNCNGRETRITSAGFTMECQAKLHVLLHDAVSPTLSFEMMLAALLYDSAELFRFGNFAQP